MERNTGRISYAAGCGSNADTVWKCHYFWWDNNFFFIACVFEQKYVRAVQTDLFECKKEWKAALLFMKEESDCLRLTILCIEGVNSSKFCIQNKVNKPKHSIKPYKICITGWMPMLCSFSYANSTESSQTSFGLWQSELTITLMGACAAIAQKASWG